MPPIYIQMNILPNSSNNQDENHKGGIMNIKSKEHILTVSMLLGAALAVLLGSFSAFAADCEELPNRLFRLHILASSDSEEDQELKYALRDYLMNDMEQAFSDCQTAEDAKQRAKEKLPEIAKKARQFVSDSGYDYKITASVENIFFTTRRYGNTVVPAGNYDALRILIGEGKGQNWWCVMFPPLCLGAVEEYLTPDQDLIIFNNTFTPPANSPNTLSKEASKKTEQQPKVEVRFALFEWLRRLCM